MKICGLVAYCKYYHLFKFYRNRRSFGRSVGHPLNCQHSVYEMLSILDIRSDFAYCFWSSCAQSKQSGCMNTGQINSKSPLDWSSHTVDCPDLACFTTHRRTSRFYDTVLARPSNHPRVFFEPYDFGKNETVHSIHAL